MKPQLRALEIIPFQQDGEEFLLLRDRQGFASDAVIPRELAPLLSLFDGTRDENAIISTYRARGGEELPLWFVQKLIGELDDQLLLNSENFRKFQDSVEEDFENSPVREAAFAGLSYSDEPKQLHAKLNEYSQQAQSLTGFAKAQNHLQTLRGIVVPHIDFGRGGVAEALAYEPLVHAARAGKTFDTLVVFGIAHSGVHYPFCAAPKDYATPLGTAECDREFLQDLQNRVGDQLIEEEYAHKNEHSIEFVAVFLQHFPELQNCKIVPILCGGFFDEIRTGVSPMKSAQIAQFIETLREVTEQHEARGRKIGFIASVDGAHVGSQFGDGRVLTSERLKEIENEDLVFWQTVEQGDAEAMHAHISKDNNARNVDAHPAVYTLLQAFPLRGELLHYGQAYHQQQNIVVSFGSMSLYES